MAASPKKPTKSAKPTKPTKQKTPTKSAKPTKPTKSTKSMKSTQPAKSAKSANPAKPRIYGMSFASVYPLYVQKATRKGRTKEEVDEIIAWLTGYRGKELQRVIDTKVDFETFFAKARMNPKAKLITGVVCGVRVETIEDPLMKKIRYLDKLIDELAQGKKMESILRK